MLFRQTRNFFKLITINESQHIVTLRLMNSELNKNISPLKLVTIEQGGVCFKNART